MNIKEGNYLDMRNNIILTDCDGVLCDWEYSFTQWMHKQGIRTKNANEYDVAIKFDIEFYQAKALVKQFNESANIAFLPPLRDAVHYMKKLNTMHGYKFHCITSLSDNKYAQRLRYQNLDFLFGREIWDEVICLPCGADKDKVLEKYKDSGCYWIEDKVENAVVGDRLGLHSVLVEHPHNSNSVASDPYAYDDDSAHIPRFDKWKHIYNYITGEGSYGV